MFESDAGGSDVGTFESGDGRTPERRQYTLKGVEADTIRLMRYAANKEGMKIGSWVSLRMREAAERALADSVERASGTRQSVPKPQLPDDSDLAVAFEHFASLWEAQLAASNERFVKLERELHELTSGQRTIMSALLANKC